MTLLLVGGVFALGLLCGQRAQAAEGVPSAVTSTQAGPATGAAIGAAIGVEAGPATGAEAAPARRAVTGVTAGSVTSPGPAGRRRPVANGLTEVLSRPFAGGLHDGVTPVARGFLDGARRVTEGLRQGTGHLREELGGSLGGMPGEPDTMPPYTALPTLPPVTTLPALASLPLLPLPLPAPVSDGPAGQASADGSRGEDLSTGTSDDADTAHPPYPRTAQAPAPATRHEAHGRRPASEAREPAPSVPFRHPAGGEPDGMLGNRAATDGTGSRCGDVLALTPVHRVPLVLVSGAAARVDAAETGDRYRDIPVSPA